MDGIVDDRKKIATMLSYTDPKYGCAHETVGKFFYETNQRSTYDDVVRHLLVVYRDHTYSFHSTAAAVMHNNYASMSINESINNMEKGAFELAYAYRDRPGYNMENDQRPMIDILSEFTFFMLVSMNCKGEAFKDLIENITEEQPIQTLDIKFLTTALDFERDHNESVFVDKKVSQF